MSAYLLVIRDRNGKPVDMGIYSGEALTIGIHNRAERAPRTYACVNGDYSKASASILAHMLADPEPWPDDLRPFVDHMLADFKPRDSYREPALETHAPAPRLRDLDAREAILSTVGHVRGDRLNVYGVGFVTGRRWALSRLLDLIDEDRREEAADLVGLEPHERESAGLLAKPRMRLVTEE